MTKMQDHASKAERTRTGVLGLLYEINLSLAKKLPNPEFYCELTYRQNILTGFILMLLLVNSTIWRLCGVLPFIAYCTEQYEQRKR